MNTRLVSRVVTVVLFAGLLPAATASAAVTDRTVLKADGPGDTYELINSVFATSGIVLETPDCAHPDFGDHITEVWDEDLERYVFAFHLHLDEDNDRCRNFDRQRNEIKAYDGSPDRLKGVIGEQVRYRHKMKLDAEFLASNRFTHVFQLKAVGTNLIETASPMITLTPRFGSPDTLQLIHVESSTSGTAVLKEVPLERFLGRWVEIRQTAVYGENGSYKLRIKDVETGATLMRYRDTSLRMWRDDATFVRPKWGIYRSLEGRVPLRDETVHFADFVIVERSNET